MILQAQIELWVLEAQAGDVNAFGQLYQHYYPQVLGFAFKVTSNKCLAQDAVQEAWIKLAKRLARLDDPAAFKSWLFKLTHWQILDMVKQARRYQQMPSDASFEIAAETDIAPTGLTEAIGRLDSLERQVIHLFYLEGFSLAEISDILGIATGTVKSRLYRARQSLKHTLEQE